MRTYNFGDFTRSFKNHFKPTIKNQHYINDFFQELSVVNLERIRIFSLIVTLLIFIFALSIDFYYFFSGSSLQIPEANNLLLIHLFAFFFYLIFSFVAKFYLKHSIDIKKTSKIILNVFSVISIGFAIIIALQRHNLDAPTSFFTIVLAAILVGFYRRLGEALLLTIISNLIFVALLYVYQDKLIVFTGQIANNMIFSTLFLLLSRSFFKIKIGEFEHLKQFEGQADVLKNKNEQLRKAKITLSSINKNIFQGLFRIDFRGRLIYVNDFFVNLFGYQSDSKLLQEWNIFQVFPKAKLRKLHRDLITQGYIKDEEFEFIREDGSAFWGLVNCSMDKNKRFFIDGSIADHTLRKQNEKALENLSLVASKTDNAVIIIDCEEKIEWVNEGFSRITGYSFEEAKGKKPGILFQGPKTDPDTVKKIGLKISKGESFIGEMLNYHKNGHEFWVHLTLNPILNGQKQIVKYIMVESDITERKKVEKELIKAKEEAVSSMKAKDEFLSMVSHELRTPLNAVIGMTHVLLQENPREDQLQNLGPLKISAEYLLSLINDILDFSKIEAGKITIDHSPFNFKEFISSLEQTFYFQSNEKNITFLTNIEESIPARLIGDPVRLNQILVNLISNSIKFTEKGFITLTVSNIDQTETDIKLHFSIKDTGIGIPDEKLKSIFDRFEQVGNQQKNKRGGTGLGLAITKNLVELMGGEIVVYSQLNKGSEFSFSISVGIATSDCKDQDKTTNLNVSEDFKGLSLLLVEDNKFNQLVAIKFLQKWNVDFDVAENGLEALAMSREKQYQIILMDLQMPEMDGFTATKQIRQMKHYQSVPIIALTAASLEAKEEVFKAGMNDFLIKPFNPVELNQKINQHFLQPAMNEENSSIHLDISEIEKISSGDNDFLLELLNICAEQLKNLPQQLKNALEQQNLPEVKNIMHKVKPSIKMLHYERLENISVDFHQLIKESGDLDLISRKADQLIEVIKAIEVELEQKTKEVKQASFNKQIG
ncbi:MAG: PAS domain S-box protein [Candidatus Cyclobacteriaceae bacterium M3_2C_046]